MPTTLALLVAVVGMMLVVFGRERAARPDTTATERVVYPALQVTGLALALGGVCVLTALRFVDCR